MKKCFDCDCCLDFSAGFHIVITYDDGTNQEFSEVCEECFAKLAESGVTEVKTGTLKTTSDEEAVNQAPTENLVMFHCFNCQEDRMLPIHADTCDSCGSTEIEEDPEGMLELMAAADEANDE